MSRLRILKRRESGQALVEFALVSIVFFIIVFGTIDVGQAVWNYNTLAQATREGTRYAIVHGAASTDPSGPGSAYYTAPDTDTKVTEAVEEFASGLDSSRLTILAEWPDGTTDGGSTIQVTSQYQYEPIFGFLSMLSFTMTSSSTMEITH